MAVSVVNVATKTGSSTTPNGNLPASITTGDFLVAFVYGTLVTVTVVPAGWQEVPQGWFGAGGTCECRVYVHPYTSGDTAPSWTINPTTPWLVGIIGVNGHDASDPISMAAAMGGGATGGSGATFFASTTLKSPQITVPDNGLAITAFIEQANKTGTVSSGTERWDAASTVGCQANTHVVSAGDVLEITETLSANDNAASGVVLIREAAANGPTAQYGFAGGAASGTTNMTITPGHLPSADSNVLLSLATSSAQTASVSGLGATWTLIGRDTNATTVSTELWLGETCDGSTATITVTRSSTSAWAWSGIEYTGMISTPYDTGTAVANHGGASTAWSGGSISPLFGKEILAASGGWTGNANLANNTPGNGFTYGPRGRTGTAVSACLFYKFQDAKTAQTPSCTLSASQTWASEGAGFRTVPQFPQRIRGINQAVHRASVI